MVKNNGEKNDQQKIEQLTADAIKASFLQVADDIRAAALQATEAAMQLTTEADQLSNELLQAGIAHADRVGNLLEKCRAASESFKEHHDALSGNRPIVHTNVTTDANTLSALRTLAKIPPLTLEDIK